ncbi:MAG TPA: LacI family DNA-binding transcriptional regulator [Acidimicrobiales bacterium]|nr:LacI family DNA-binding transcriptional regulator [Acidimicrobiales bacterium]
MPSRPRITLARLSAECGVSVATISNAFNRPDQLSKELRELVLKKAEELGFAGPDPAARSLRRGRVNAVGLLLGQTLSHAFSDPGTIVLLDGVARELQLRQMSLLLVPSTGRAESDEQLVRNAVVDAWIACALDADDPVVDAVLQRRQPVVVLDQPDRAGLALFSPDDVGGAREVVEHLVGLGHRRIGIVATELVGDGLHGLASARRQARCTFATTRRRLRGARQAVEAAGLEWSSVPVVEAARNDQMAGSVAASLLLARRSPPSAIFAFTDELALGVLHAARAAGLAVPDDVSVAGFDNMSGGRFADPPLTTVEQHLGERGLLAARALCELIDGTAGVRSQVTATRLVVRESTARPPGPGRGRRAALARAATGP